MSIELSCRQSPAAVQRIAVKTTNGGQWTAFFVSLNQPKFAEEQEDAFQLYRLFQFRTPPMLYMLHGDLTKPLQLETIAYRTLFSQIVG